MDSLDRVLALTGARRLVAVHPRMKWLLLEFAPVLAWSRVTGAGSFDSVYLVSYLLLLGARPQELAVLPLVCYLGSLLSAVFMHLRSNRDSAGLDTKRLAVRTALVSRLIWFGTVVWPLAFLGAGDRRWLMLGGVLACALFAQIATFVSMASWTAWTQTVVPVPLRGSFFAWRTLSGMALLMVLMQVLSLCWPEAGRASDAAQLAWLMGLFGLLGLACLASTGMLAASPELPWIAARGTDPGRVQPTGVPPSASASLQALEHAVPSLPAAPRHPAPGGNPRWPFARLIVFNLFHSAALACVPVALKPFLVQIAVSDAVYARFDGWIRCPAMIGGILLGAALLGRVGGRRLLCLANLALAGAYVCILHQDTAGTAWWLGSGFGLEGLALGLLSVCFIGHIYEILPSNDSRLAALVFGAGGLAGVCAALGQFAAGALLPPACLPVLLLTATVALRLCGGLVLLFGRR